MNKKRLIGWFILIALLLSLSGCGSSGSSSSYRSSSNVGAGGYEMPNSNDASFSDYVKRVAPDLYDGMQSRYDSLTK